MIRGLEAVVHGTLVIIQIVRHLIRQVCVGGALVVVR